MRLNLGGALITKSRYNSKAFGILGVGAGLCIDEHYAIEKSSWSYHYSSSSWPPLVSKSTNMDLESTTFIEYESF